MVMEEIIKEVKETEIDNSKEEKLELDFNMDASERLTKEVAFTDSAYQKVVGNFLIQKFKEDAVLEKAYSDRKITLNQIWKSIVEVAKKKAKNGACCMADDEVFGFAIHFIQDGEIKETKETTYVLSKESQESLKERAEREFIQEQKRKLEEAEKRRIEKEKRVKERAVEKERKEREESGQLDLFDLLEQENE